MYDLKTMQLAYLTALYWTETGDDGQPPSDAEITPLCNAKALNDCAAFYRAVTQNVQDFLPVLDWSQIGHDFWLTRNGHGAGFWDRPEVYGPLGSKWLTAMAQACGEHYAEFIDDVDALTTYTLPAAWAGALINNDFSGLDASEAEYLDAWLKHERPGQCLSCSDEPFFARTHDAYGVMPLAAECLDYTFTEDL